MNVGNALFLLVRNVLSFSLISKNTYMRISRTIILHDVWFHVYLSKRICSSWITLHGKLRKIWSTTLRYRNVTLLIPCTFLHWVHQPIYYSIKHNIYWLLSWINVKGLMDGDVREILRIKNKKLNAINVTVRFLNWWGKSICTIAAEKHRKFYSRQYGDWGQVFIVGIGIHYELDGTEMESQWGGNLTWCPDRSWCQPSILYKHKGSLSWG